MISGGGGVMRDIKTGTNMRGSLSRGKLMGRGCTVGQMGRCTMGSGGEG